MDGFTHYIVNFSWPLDWTVYGNAKLKKLHPDTRWAIVVRGPKQSLMFAVPTHTKIEDVIASIRSIYGVNIDYNEVELY